MHPCYIRDYWLVAEVVSFNQHSYWLFGDPLPPTPFSTFYQLNRRWLVGWWYFTFHLALFHNNTCSKIVTIVEEFFLDRQISNERCFWFLVYLELNHRKNILEVILLVVYAYVSIVEFRFNFQRYFSFSFI